MPSRVRAAPSPIPPNLPSTLASAPSVLLPNNVVKAVLPMSANCPDPPIMPARFSSKLEGRAAILFSSCRAPSGFETRFASPERIAGTAPDIVFCPLATSEIPAAEAILATRSGFKNSVSNGVIFPYIATSLLATAGGTDRALSRAHSKGAPPAKADDKAVPCAQNQGLVKIGANMQSVVVDC